MKPTVYTGMAVALLLVHGCAETSIQTSQPGLAGVPRGTFNSAALELFLPLFWNADKNQNGELEPDELSIIWGFDSREPDYWVANGTFTLAMREAFARIEEHVRQAARKPTPDARHQALLHELSQRRISVIDNDFSQATAQDRALVQHLMIAARLIERVHARQLGTWGMESYIPPIDTLSRLVFFLNHGPSCTAPQTMKDASCSALESAPLRHYGLYPDAVQADRNFCDKMAREHDHALLANPFAVVIKNAAGHLGTQPYSQVYREDMLAISDELRHAAQALTSADELALKTYLDAAALAFMTDNWPLADEAWAKMNGSNSKWYVRVAPDEVYFDPCGSKAGFQLTFARINQASLIWQKTLEPLKNDLEKAMAMCAGPPYVLREVTLHWPDFFDIVLNAGAARMAQQAIVGQALPNWGPVAREGRGRTTVMTGFYADADSRKTSRRQAESILCSTAMNDYSDDDDAARLGMILHEAAHDLGPAHNYKIAGKLDTEVFGGAQTALLEELKAQTSALFLLDVLAGMGAIDQSLAHRAQLHELLRAFGYLADGAANATPGENKPYGAIAAMQIGALLKEGGLTWSAGGVAANGEDHGCIDVDREKLPIAIVKLETTVLGIKARGDRTGASELAHAYVDSEGCFKSVEAAIRERYQRVPAPTFLYSFRF